MPDVYCKLESSLCSLALDTGLVEVSVPVQAGVYFLIPIALRSTVDLRADQIAVIFHLIRIFQTVFSDGRITPQKRTVGRARSPLRTGGVGHTDPASSVESGFAAPLRARLRSSSSVGARKHAGDSGCAGRGLPTLQEIGSFPEQ